MIYTKYLKAAITYEYDGRVETYPFPREGVREAIYNAFGHLTTDGSLTLYHHGDTTSRAAGGMIAECMNIMKNFHGKPQKGI